MPEVRSMNCTERRLKKEDITLRDTSRSRRSSFGVDERHALGDGFLSPGCPSEIFHFLRASALRYQTFSHPSTKSHVTGNHTEKRSFTTTSRTVRPGTDSIKRPSELLSRTKTRAGRSARPRPQGLKLRILLTHQLHRTYIRIAYCPS